MVNEEQNGVGNEEEEEREPKDNHHGSEAAKVAGEIADGEFKQGTQTSLLVRGRMVASAQRQNSPAWCARE